MARLQGQDHGNEGKKYIATNSGHNRCQAAGYFERREPRKAAADVTLPFYFSPLAFKTLEYSRTVVTSLVYSALTSAIAYRVS